MKIKIACWGIQQVFWGRQQRRQASQQAIWAYSKCFGADSKGARQASKEYGHTASVLGQTARQQHHLPTRLFKHTTGGFRNKNRFKLPYYLIVFTTHRNLQCRSPDTKSITLCITNHFFNLIQIDHK